MKKFENFGVEPIVSLLRGPGIDLRTPG